MSVELLHISDTTSMTKMKAQMDGLEATNKMDAVKPKSLSMLDSNPNVYKRQTKKKVDRRGRFRTQPVTFSEIKEVDEELIDENLVKSDKNDPKSNPEEKRKCSQLLRSHSCRKPETIQRRRAKIGRGSEENVVMTPDDESELMDEVDENLSNITISLKCLKGVSTRPVPSI